MEIYILDSLLRRETLVDKFLSVIWTERFNAFGEFKLELLSTPNNRRLFTNGRLLACNNSNYVMRVATLEDSTDSDGRATFIVSGYSLEEMLTDRAAAAALVSTTTTPTWNLTNTPGEISRKIFRDICITGTLSVYDKIPYIVEGRLPSLPASNIAEEDSVITLALEPQSVYDAIKAINDTYNLGFRILRNADQSQLYFDVYSGIDRTTGQTLYPAVVFSPELDSLENTTELNSLADYKNVALVFSPAGYATVYADNVNPDIEGFERRALVVNASDIDSTATPSVAAALTQRGKEELASHRGVRAFDGEINPNANYKYGTHYHLGDLIEIRNVDGVTNQMRVTEQIFVSDGEGERAYPTLSAEILIETGTWLSWESNQVWSELGPTEYWATS